MKRKWSTSSITAPQANTVTPTTNGTPKLWLHSTTNGTLSIWIAQATPHPPKSNTVQQVVHTFIYYARAVNPIMLMKFNSIAAERSNIAEATSKSVTQLLNYATTHSEGITIYHASGIILHIHSNASFLSDHESKSIVGREGWGYH